jgi:hypothetical protein
MGVWELTVKKNETTEKIRNKEWADTDAYVSEKWAVLSLINRKNRHKLSQSRMKF